MRKLESIILSIGVLISMLISTSTVALAQADIDVDLDLISSDVELINILENVVSWIMGIAGAIAVIYLIYGGITYITGGEKGAEGGKKIIVNAIIGLAIIALSAVIANTVMGILNT